MKKLRLKYAGEQPATFTLLHPEEIENGIEEVYKHIRESFQLAMTCTFLDNTDGVKEVLDTVNDAVTNNWDHLVAAFLGEDNDDG